MTRPPQPGDTKKTVADFPVEPGAVRIIEEFPLDVFTEMSGLSWATVTDHVHPPHERLRAQPVAAYAIKAARSAVAPQQAADAGVQERQWQREQLQEQIRDLLPTPPTPAAPAPS